MVNNATEEIALCNVSHQVYYRIALDEWAEELVEGVEVLHVVFSFIGRVRNTSILQRDVHVHAHVH